MLVLSRKPAETIQIGDDIVIKVIRTGSGAVKLGIDAPDHVRVMRGELLTEKKPNVPLALISARGTSLLSDQFPHVA